MLVHAHGGVGTPGVSRGDGGDIRVVGSNPMKVCKVSQVCGALRELAEAQTCVALPPPPDPAASWDAFAASWLEWEVQAAVPLEVLYLAYACRCAAYGEPVLPEDQVLAWLTAHGATVRTGALSQVTAVEGVRVVD
jgi:hypothetical protein